MRTSPRAEGAAGTAPPAPLRTRVLGVPVDVVDLPQAVDVLTHLVGGHGHGEPAVVVTLNPEMVMLARRDTMFAAVLDQAALLVPDGVGIVRALQRRGFSAVQRVSGVELMDAYLPVAATRGHRVALAGGRPGIAQRAAAALQARLPGLEIVAAEGGAPDDGLAKRLRGSSPDLVCAAFGHGRQEAFLAQHLPAIGASAGIGVGGWLDYLAGAVRRAPAPVRDAGLEWAWRLALQPWRVRRQLVLPRFLVLERKEARLRRRAAQAPPC